jgi:Helix-turn-helix domain
VSLALTTLAWKLKLAPSPKLVLLALCEHANDAGVCWPSIATLARCACISERQAKRVVHKLIETGFAAVIGNELGGHRNQSRRYQLNASKLTEMGCQIVTGDKTSRVTSETHRGDIAVSPESLLKATKSKKRKEHTPSEMFARFWTAYPVKVDRAKCETRWRRLNLDSLAQTIVADVEKKKQLDRRWLSGYVPNPMTYMNQERWNDPVIPQASNQQKHVGETFGDKNYQGTPDDQLQRFLKVAA